MSQFAQNIWIKTRGGGGAADVNCKSLASLFEAYFLAREALVGILFHAEPERTGDAHQCRGKRSRQRVKRWSVMEYQKQYRQCTLKQGGRKG